MAFWKNLFGSKSDAAAAAPLASGLVAKYCHKYAGYQEIVTECEAVQDILGKLQQALTREPVQPGVPVRQLLQDLLVHLEQTVAVLQTFCRQPPAAIVQAYEEVAGRLRQALAQLEPGSLSSEAAANLWQTLKEITCPPPPVDRQGEASSQDACLSMPALLQAITESRLAEMFCLSLRGQVSKKEAASLVTGRMVPILIVDVGGGLARPGPTVGQEDITSVPFQAFLSGMLSIPWPKARPVDMKGFISVVGVTSTTPRAEDQLKKISLAILARDYMNFSLCLGYHASTIEAYVRESSRCNYLRFHYEGGAASVERRVRRLRLISGILTRLGFEVTITGDLLDGRRSGDAVDPCLKLLEILGRLEVFTKQMDMVMSSDEVIFDYIEDFLANHC